MISIVFLYALCASSFTLCKAVLMYSKPIFFVGVRMIAAGLLLTCGWVWYRVCFIAPLLQGAHTNGK